MALTPDGRLAVSASGDDARSRCGTWPAGRRCAPWLAIPLRSPPWRSRRTGRLAVSASWDDTLKVWDVASGQALRTLAGHTSWVNAVALTPDGRLAVSASEDYTLKVWDVASGQELRTLAGHTGRSTRWRSRRMAGWPSRRRTTTRSRCGTWRAGGTCHPDRPYQLGHSRGAHAGWSAGRLRRRVAFQQ